MAATLPKVFDIPWYNAMGAGTLLYLLTGGFKWVRLASMTLGLDFSLIKVMLAIELSIRKWNKAKMIVGDIFAEQVAKTPNKKAFVSADTGESLTFQEAEDLANKMANIFYEAGLRKGDAVALVMENRIEYVPIWVGLSKIGVVASLINFNLRGESLKHCITVSNCKAVVFSGELAKPIEEISDIEGIEFYCFDRQEVNIAAGCKQLQDILPKASSAIPPRPAEIALSDELLHIFTSGTTGLPKAAIIRGFRAMYMCGGIGAGNNITHDDVIYNALPLYHSNGGLGLAGNTIRIGCTLVIRKKFSASRYFEGCCKYEATVINYIGEICRYLLATPVKDTDKAHKIRVATGNGLRASIWQEFQDRFNIPRCVEFYGATEGNANMINTVGRVGAVGFNSVIFPFIFPIKLVKVDEETGELIRGSNGLAAPAQTGEVGLLVGKVKKDVMHRFDGYLNQKATQKKLAFDVFSKGDSAFLTGDMLMQDEEGFYYFQDRTGDTFRWKGENVSTNEVEGVISKALELSDVCVYGVEVPGIEGRAGMACICDPNREANIEDLQKFCEQSLPPYARPMFIRQQSAELEKTGTHKFKKNKLRDQGFNPALCDATDTLHYFDGKQRKYVLVDSSVYDSILKQDIRF